MNEIKLKGIIRDIQPSHKIKEVDYDKANIVVKRKDGKEDTLNLRFKKFSNVYTEDAEIELSGNVRSYSRQLENGKNKVDIYVFTYFDKPDLDENDQEVLNGFDIDGRICKIDEIRATSKGKQNIHFVLANNLVIEDTNQKLNSYLPCVAWGKIARDIAKLSINDKIRIKGELHSREYTKVLEDGSIEIRVAHELLVSSFEVLE